MSLVLFDVDGTLLHAFGAGRKALETAFRDVFGTGDLDGRAGSVRFNGRTDPQIIADLATLAGVSPGRLHEESGRLRASYLAALEAALAAPGSASPLPGVKPLLAALRGRGIPVGLLTGNIEAGARLKLRAAGLEEEFFGDGPAGGFGSDDADRVAIGRIAFDRFRAARGVDAPPESVVVIGDAVEDIRSARANGFSTLAVLTGWTSAEDLSAEGPGRIVPDLADTGAVLAHIDPPPA